MIIKALPHTSSPVSSNISVGNHTLPPFVVRSMHFPCPGLPLTRSPSEFTTSLLISFFTATHQEEWLLASYRPRYLTHLPSITKATKWQEQDWNSGPWIPSSELFPLHPVDSFASGKEGALEENSNKIKWPGSGLSTRHKRCHLCPTMPQGGRCSHDPHAVDEKQSLLRGWSIESFHTQPTRSPPHADLSLEEAHQPTTCKPVQQCYSESQWHGPP